MASTMRGAMTPTPANDAGDLAPASLPEIERKVSGLGAKVAAERAERGWSLAQLAQRAGMSPAAVHKIEKNGMTPTIASLMKIAAALGRSVSYFVEEPATPGRQRDPRPTSGRRCTRPSRAWTSRTSPAATGRS